MSPTGGRLDDRRGQATETRPASIAGVFVRNAERAPEKLCIRFEGEDWSYGRLLRRGEAFAAALKTWGLRPGASAWRSSSGTTRTFWRPTSARTWRVA